MVIAKVSELAPLGHDTYSSLSLISNSSTVNPGGFVSGHSLPVKSAIVNHRGTTFFAYDMKGLLHILFYLTEGNSTSSNKPVRQ